VTADPEDEATDPEPIADPSVEGDAGDLGPGSAVEDREPGIEG
jgi:hypothetical protein